MNIVVIAAMEEEAVLLRESLQQCKVRKFIGHTFYEGLLHDTPVVVAQSGIGKVNAAVMTTAAIARFVPRLVINTGCAGATASDLKQGDIIIAKEVAYHDVDVTSFGYCYGQVPKEEARFKINPAVLESTLRLAQGLQERFMPYRLDTGLIVSGDQFIHSQAQRVWIKKHFPDALAVEMEAAAIAQTCRMLSTPYLIVRSISDMADGTAPLNFDQFLPLAAKHSAQVVSAIIEQSHCAAA